MARRSQGEYPIWPHTPDLCAAALQNKATEAVVMALLDAWPDAVKEKDNGVYSGHPTPLYFALNNNAPEVVAMALLKRGQKQQV